MAMDPTMYLEQARRAGAEVAEVYYSASQARPVFFEANRLKQLESTASEGVALRVWQNGRSGLAVAYGPVDGEMLAQKALALAALNPPTPPRFGSPRRVEATALGLEVPTERLVELGRSAIADLRAEFPEILCGGELAWGWETTRLINSEGLDCTWTESSVSYYLGAEWIRGDDFLAVYDGDQRRENINLDEVVENLRQRLRWAQHYQAIAPQKMPILLTSNAASLLWETVSAALNGKNILDGSSPWAQRLGHTVASADLTLTQDPSQSPYDCPFDDEGSPTQPLTILDQGAIAQWYTDLETADRLGMVATGNGFRAGLGSYPSPGLLNLMVTPGTGTLGDLLTTLGDGLMVDQLLGGGADISGDFSVNVDLGYRVQQGKITGRVKDIMITGNVYDLLPHITHIGGDRRWQGSCATPSLIVDGISVVS